MNMILDLETWVLVSPCIFLLTKVLKAESR
jgi:hypothetical protein